MINSCHCSNLPALTTNLMLFTNIITSTNPLPINHKSLYVRTSYNSPSGNLKDLGQNRVCLIGTSGIGKSTFLLYCIIRLVHDMTGDPPIIILHSDRPNVYVFAGTTNLLLGSFDNFRPFLQLSNICVMGIPGRYPRPVVYTFPGLRGVPVAQHFLET